MNSKMQIDLPRLEFDKLPIEFTFPGLEHIKIRAEVYNDSHWSLLYHHVQDSHLSGTGFPEETLLYIRDDKDEPVKPGQGKIVFLNVSDGELIAAMTVKPSNVCRSEKPLYSMGFLLVSKAYRGQQIAFYMMKMYKDLSRHHGYRGSIGKGAADSRSLVPAMKAGSYFLGIVPWSAYLSGKGWFHDIIVHGKYDNLSVIPTKSHSIPTLGDRTALEATHPVFKRPAPTHHLPVIHHRVFGNLKISPADNNELWDIQHILRNCALEGDGFGLDEFTKDGVFNEKMIRECCHWVVKRELDEHVLAVVLSGEAAYRRSAHHLMANGVIVVLKSFRRQGLASQLLQFCEDHCQKLGFKHILTDVLACNQAGLGLLERHGFLVTGTVPDSCAMNRHGQGIYVSSLLQWKPLSAGPPSPPSARI